jgi:kinesin family protein C2/C3
VQLTRLLEDALGGNSKTILVVNCSPAAENLGETRCSLDFAARARQVELGAAKRNTVAARPAVDSDGAGASPTAAAGSGAGGASGRDTLRAGAAGLQGSRLLAPQRAQR